MWCGVVWCDVLLLAVWCGYTILQAVLVRFLRFVRFGEHPYPNLYLCQFRVGQGRLICRTVTWRDCAQLNLSPGQGYAKFTVVRLWLGLKNLNLPSYSRFGLMSRKSAQPSSLLNIMKNIQPATCSKTQIHTQIHMSLFYQ